MLLSKLPQLPQTHVSGLSQQFPAVFLFLQALYDE
jgi:hypothetical protein